MENKKETDPQDQTIQSDLADAGKTDVSAPPESKPAAVPADNAREARQSDDLHAAIAEQSARIAKLCEDLAQQKTDFQNTEVSLVTRIADVDDDRRHAATRLQRTLQSQRDELDARYRRQNAIVIATLLSFLLLAGGGLAFFYFKFNETRQSFAKDVGELKQALDQIHIPEASIPDQATREKLSQLSTAVKAMTSSLENLGEEQENVPVVQPGEDTAAPAPEPVLKPQQTEQPGPRPEEIQPPSASSENGEPTGKSAIEEAPTPEPSPASAPGKPPANDPVQPPAASEGSTAPASSALPKELKVSDKTFSVQLMGFHSLDSLRKFASRPGMPSHLQYQEDTYQGRPWFVLIHSLHATRESANAAVAGLPKELAELTIWVRQLDPDTIVYRFDPGSD